MPARIAISLGDLTGIGPEVTLKALAAELPVGDTRYLLLGDAARLRRLNEQLGLGLPLPLPPWGEGRGEGDAQDRISIATTPDAPAFPPALPPGCPEAARAAVAWLAEGARLCLRGEADALVTAPVNKKAILRAGQPFVGQTEFLSELAGCHRTAMMLLGHDDRGRWLRVALATTHVPLKQVPAALTKGKIELAIELAAQACRDLGLPRARIGVCGLNPHAGEGGELGDEEQTTIQPAIEAARRKKCDVAGPLPADTLFHHALRGDYEAVVAMYHDQGLAPLKMIAFETGVNWTLGLPFIRTSPDHGTAYDIAGQGLANPSSMLCALRLAKTLARRREAR
jgi:4-hydroxythreonine-4-phosphate dehydrogenase